MATQAPSSKPGRNAALIVSNVSFIGPQSERTVEEEEESSHPCVECEVPRELLLHRSKLISPPVLGFERFEENKCNLGPLTLEKW